MNRVATSLVWYHKNSTNKPLSGKKIIVYSDTYEKTDPRQVRVIESDYFKIFEDIDYWAYINKPE